MFGLLNASKITFDFLDFSSGNPVITMTDSETRGVSMSSPIKVIERKVLRIFKDCSLISMFT